MTVKKKIQLKRASAAELASLNPVLAAGEAAVDLTNHKLKVGDGTTAYNSLPYVEGNIDLSNYYTKSETYSQGEVDSLLGGKVDTEDLATVATTGSYNDLLNKPNIPDVSDYYDKTEVDGKLAEKEDAFDATLPLEERVIENYKIVSPIAYDSVSDTYYSNANAAYPQLYDSDYLLRFSTNPTDGDIIKALDNQGSGYCLLPYTIGDTITYCSSVSTYATSGTHGGVGAKGIIGNISNGVFTPVMLLKSSSDNRSITLCYGGTYADGDYIRCNNRAVVGSYSRGETMAWGVNQVFAQIRKVDDNNIMVTHKSQGYDCSYTANSSSSADLFNALNSVNCVLFLAGYSNGKYMGYSGQSFKFATGTDNYCGTSASLNLHSYTNMEQVTAFFSDDTNTLDPTKLPVEKKLQLNIGAGLAVQNGNLVNTNPTPVTLDKINQSKALETGDISTDADVYADILEYSNTTFSKIFSTTGTVSLANSILSNVQANSFVSGGTFTLGSSGVFEIDFDITLGDASSISYFIDYANGTSNEIILRQQATYNQLQALFFTSGTTITVQSSIISIEGQRAKGKFGYDGTSYYLTVNGTTDTQTSSDKMPSGDYTRYFGNRYTTPSNSYLTGNRTINLGEYREFVDGECTFAGSSFGTDVYNLGKTTISIPYEKSRNGAKFANSSNRANIQKVMNAFGVAPYYTIDTTSQNFTLPSGDMYSMIEKVNDDIFYKPGDIFVPDTPMYCAGNVYQAKDTFLATIYLPKSIKYVNSITFTGGTSYVVQEGQRFLVDPSNSNQSFTLFKTTPNCIGIRVRNLDGTEMLPNGRDNCIFEFNGTQQLNFS